MGHRSREEIVRRFWSKVDIQSEYECWPWLAGRFSTGYGQFKYYGKSTNAHRVAWELEYGNIPKDGYGNTMYVLHACDNAICCNPKHLFLGTARDNMRDKIAKDRANFSRRGKGRKGYYWREDRKKWVVQISNGGKRYTLGQYDNEDEAKSIYEETVKELDSGKTQVGCNN
jgi:hypothetical protein